MKKYFLILLFSIVVLPNMYAQEKIGAELYTYVGTKPAIQPLLHIQSANNWYGELRYNYEDAETFSLYGGKTFSGGNNLEYSITPMAGYSTGRFNGLSFAFNTEVEWKAFYFSSQTQYSIATKKNDSLSVKKSAENFFFSWSELGYTIGDHFFTGVSIQYTRQAGETIFEPGLLAGLNFKKLSFPFYVFSPFHRGRYFILGVNYEFSLKNKR
jgi:hypothetical protein